MIVLTEEQSKELVHRLNLKCNYNYLGRDSAKFHCCFHTDKTPSLSVDFKKGIYHCFSCNRGGSLNSLAKIITGRWGVDLLGLGPSSSNFLSFYNQPTYIESKAITEDDIHIDVRGVTKQWFQSPEAIAYLRSRYITDTIATKAHIQYVDEAYINGTYFNKRLLIPVYGSHNNLINIEGRDVTRKQKLKVLYPKNTLKPIYEWYTLDKNKPVYLVEGIVKLLVLRSDPYFENSTSLMGASTSDYQISLLNEFPHIIIIPDQDSAGAASTKDLIARLKSKVSILRIHQAGIKDADEIPEKTGLTIKQFREANGFMLDSF